MIMLNKKNINPFANAKLDEFFYKIMLRNVLFL